VREKTGRRGSPAFRSRGLGRGWELKITEHGNLSILLGAVFDRIGSGDIGLFAVVACADWSLAKDRRGGVTNFSLDCGAGGFSLGDFGDEGFRFGGLRAESDFLQCRDGVSGNGSLVAGESIAEHRLAGVVGIAGNRPQKLSAEAGHDRSLCSCEASEVSSGVSCLDRMGVDCEPPGFVFGLFFLDSRNLAGSRAGGAGTGRAVRCGVCCLSQTRAEIYCSAP